MIHPKIGEWATRTRKKKKRTKQKKRTVLLKQKQNKTKNGFCKMLNHKREKKSGDCNRERRLLRDWEEVTLWVKKFSHPGMIQNINWKIGRVGGSSTDWYLWLENATSVFRVSQKGILRLGRFPEDSGGLPVEIRFCFFLARRNRRR